MPVDEYAPVAWAYDALIGPFLAPARRMVRRALARLAPRGGRVLDLGCGTGVLASALATDGWRVACLDASASMLGRACRAKPVPLVRGDATAMPLAANAFDACTAIMVMHEMDPDTRRAALGEALRVLVPGGLLLAVDYLVPARSGHAAVLFGARLAERAAGRRHYRMFRQFTGTGGLEALLRDAGLEPEPMGRCLLGAAGLMVAKAGRVMDVACATSPPRH